MRHYPDKDTEVAAYYDQTQVHYRYFWKLDDHHTLHYGLWESDVRSLGVALERTNIRLAELAGIGQGDRVLDAGCGLGGPARWLAQTYACKVLGMSLSQKQVHAADRLAKEQGLDSLVSFQVGNYCSSGLEDASFDVVWAVEAHATEVDKVSFVQEAYRLLRPGGTLIMADYLQAKEVLSEKEACLLEQWLTHWAIQGLCSQTQFSDWLDSAGFSPVQVQDVTGLIIPSARRMYRASFAGWLGTKVYNLYRRATPYSRTHYRAGWAQYRALKQGLWEYALIKAVKP